MSTHRNSQPVLVTDPYSGKKYDLGPLFDYLYEDGTPLEELHYSFADAVYEIVQATDFEYHPQRLIKSACFLLSQLEKRLRPEVLLINDEKTDI